MIGVYFALVIAGFVVAVVASYAIAAAFNDTNRELP